MQISFPCSNKQLSIWCPAICRHICVRYHGFHVVHLIGFKTTRYIPKRNCLFFFSTIECFGNRAELVIVFGEETQEFTFTKVNIYAIQLIQKKIRKKKKRNEERGKITWQSQSWSLYWKLKVEMLKKTGNNFIFFFFKLAKSTHPGFCFQIPNVQFRFCETTNTSNTLSITWYR